MPRSGHASRSSAASGRSVATAPAIEVDGRIMLLDCGLMFPDIDMLGIDLVLPDFTYLRENADRIDGVHRHPRPRGPRRRARVPAARAVVPDLRLGAHARPGPQPHRGGRAARPHRADPGHATASGARSARSTSSSSRSPTRCPTGSPPRSTRRRARSCTAGDFKLDLTPVDGRLTDLAASGAIAKDEGIRLLLADSTNADEHGPRRLRDVGRQGALRPVPRQHEGRRIVTACFASHIHRVQQIADAAIVVRPQGRHAGPVDEEERASWRARWACCASPTDTLVDIDDVGDLAAGRGLRHLARAARASRCRRWRCMAAGENRWLKIGRRRHRDPQLAPDPRQRDERVAR